MLFYSVKVTTNRLIFSAVPDGVSVKLSCIWLTLLEFSLLSPTTVVLGIIDEFSGLFSTKMSLIHF